MKASARGVTGAIGAAEASAGVSGWRRRRRGLLGVAALAVLVDAVAGDVLGAGVDVGARVVAVAAAEARREPVAVAVGRAPRAREQQRAGPSAPSVAAAKPGAPSRQAGADHQARARTTAIANEIAEQPTAGDARAAARRPVAEPNQKNPCPAPATTATASA